jgi:PAS domain S-box-containing protein
VTIDEDGIVFHANPAAHRLFGVDPGSMHTRSISEFIQNQDDITSGGLVGKWKGGYSTVPNEGLEIAGLRGDGSVFPMQMTIGETPFEDRSVYTVLLRDLTKIRMKNREANLAKFSVDRAGDAVYWVDSGARIRYANQAAELMLGYTFDELVSKKVFDIDTVMTGEQWGEHWEELSRLGTLTLESEHKRSDGTCLPVEINVNYLYFQGEEFNCAFVRDISLRKRAEFEIRESETRKSAILEAALDCIISIDHSGRIIEFNPAAERVFGYSRSEALGNAMAELIVPERLRGSHHEGMRHYLETGEGPVIGKRIEVPAVRRNGEEFPIEISIVAIHLDEQPIFTAYLRDITQQKKTMEELESAKDAAETASRHKSQFLAGMSHEIRTPMTAISGYADLLSRPSVDPDQAREWGRMLRYNTQYLLSLLGDILDLSRIEAGQVDIEEQAFDLPTFLFEIEAMFRLMANEKLLDFGLEIKGRIPRTIKSDPLRLKQVMVNLINNAIKFTDQGTVRITVGMSTEGGRGSDTLYISVVDTGIGISEEDQKKLFEPFYQVGAEKQSKATGTGLGLAISHQLSRMLGGDIAVESEAGKGSTFTLRLPFDVVSGSEVFTGDQARNLEAELDAMAQAPSLKDARVLVVDDNHHNRAIVRFMLDDAGAVVVVANNGQEAVDEVDKANREDKPFDLVLMDMQMPIKDGYTATREIRETGCEVPVVALTAYAMSGDAKRCLEAGCDAYLPKPIVPDEFYSLVYKMLSPDHEAGPKEIRSTMADDPKFAPLLKDYRQSLHEAAGQIQGMMERGDTESLLVVIHRLRGTATNFGFPQITELAGVCEDEMRSHPGGTVVEGDRSLTWSPREKGDPADGSIP